MKWASIIYIILLIHNINMHHGANNCFELIVLTAIDIHWGYKLPYCKKIHDHTNSNVFLTESNIAYKDLSVKDESNVSILCCQADHHKIVVENIHRRSWSATLISCAFHVFMVWNLSSTTPETHTQIVYNVEETISFLAFDGICLFIIGKWAFLSERLLRFLNRV